MTLEDRSIKETAEILSLDKNIVDLVIAHKTKAMYQALGLHKTVEDSGLGTFKIRSKTVVNGLIKYDRLIEGILRVLAQDDLMPRKRKGMENLLAQRIEEKTYLESKV